MDGTDNDLLKVYEDLEAKVDVVSNKISTLLITTDDYFRNYEMFSSIIDQELGNDLVYLINSALTPLSKGEKRWTIYTWLNRVKDQLYVQMRNSSHLKRLPIIRCFGKSGFTWHTYKKRVRACKLRQQHGILYIKAERIASSIQLLIEPLITNEDANIFFDQVDNGLIDKIINIIDSELNDDLQILLPNSIDQKDLNHHPEGLTIHEWLNIVEEMIFEDIYQIFQDWYSRLMGKEVSIVKGNFADLVFGDIGKLRKHYSEKVKKQEDEKEDQKRD